MAERRTTEDPPQKPAPGRAGPDRASSASSAAPSVVPTAPTLSLSKGGGAIRGLGEAFSTNLASGTVSLSVPIATSPGRSGFELHLGLDYDSGAGNGPFGVGWHLSVPAITRKTNKGLPRYLDGEDSDVFVFSGAEDLVPVRRGGALETTTRDGHRIQRYRPRIEGLFARIERWTHEVTGDVHWRSITRDNVTNLYGRSADARIADPAAPERVFSWLLEETRDDRGNVARYTYQAEDGAGVDPARASEANRFKSEPGGSRRFLATADRHLKRIQYGNRVPLKASDPAPEAASAWLFEVVFDHGEHDAIAPTLGDTAAPWSLRADPFSSSRAGFEIRTYRLCRRVLVFHRFAELGAAPCLVRSTDFTYDATPTLTYLTKVEQAGYTRDPATGAYARAALPPLALEYARIGELSDEVRTLDRASLEGLPAGIDGATAQWIDLDGEGIPGVLRAEERGWYYKSNLGEGQLAPPTLLRSLPVPAELRGGLQQLADLDGDGRLDLVRYAPPLSGYFARTSDGDWEPFAPLRAIPDIDWNDANLRSVDLDGDGHPDVLITEHDALVWYRSLAQEGFEPARRISKPWDEEQGPAVVFADGTESIHLADMSGDGLADLVRVRNGEVCYWPNLGHGRFGAKITLEGSPCFDRPDQFDPKRVRFVDVDGSGTTDILYLGREGVAIYLNQSGNGLSERRLITSLPLADTLSATTVVDLLGRGTACLVWSSVAPGSADRPLAYIDLLRGEKPHLLVAIDNNLGAETRVTYASSTRFYLADKLAGKPWITRLPFPVQVVERVTVVDRISKNRFVTRHAYHHGYFDGVEREFRGFGCVEQWDTEELGAPSASGDYHVGNNVNAASYVPPVLTRTWFHTGAFLDAERISRGFAGEYYRESDPSRGDSGLTDEQLRAMLLPDTILPADLSADDMREACRALKGSILRQEIYSMDGSEEEDRPYLVSERSFTVVPVQPRGEGRFAVFFTHPREVIDFHHERKLVDVGGQRLADPRVTHAFTLAVDPFGNVLESVAVGYGRRRDDPDPLLSSDDRDRQRRLHITFTEGTYTRVVEQADAWRAPLACESWTHEITRLLPASSLSGVTNLFRFDEMAAAMAGLRDGAHDLPYEDREGAGATAPHAYRRLIEHARTLYRRDDLTGPLPLGDLESRALPYESYKLAFTPGLVGAVYEGRVTEAMLATEGRYVHSEGDASWWIPSGRAFYSRREEDTSADELDHAGKHFFLPCRFVDPFGKTTTVTYDPYDLLPWQTRDAVGNLVTVGARDAAGTPVENGNDYRVLQPRQVMDANRNRVALAFDRLGLVVGTAVMGKPEEKQGDSLEGFVADLSSSEIAEQLADPLADPHRILQRATTRLVYDLFAHQRTAKEPQPQPVVVHVLARETHDADLKGDAKTRVQHGFSYSDGFGREIQKKAQAEPGPLTPDGPDVGPRWVGSGWTIFNNKGKPVRKYEPFFTTTHRFEVARIVGVSSVLFHDPTGRVVATLHPNHTHEKVVFDPWKQVTWDVNDTVLVADPKLDPDVGDFFRRLPDAAEYLPTWHSMRKDGALGAEEKAAAKQAAMHAGTPTVAYFDALGRPFLTVAHNRRQYSDEAAPSEERHATRVRLDIEGNQREVIDALQRVVMRHDHDMLGAQIHQASMEAGARWTLNDVAGKPIRAWDSRGHAFHTEYDDLHRPLRAFVKGANPDKPEQEILFETTDYGEGQPDDVALNLRTRVFRHRDGAGVVLQEAHDFKGNLLRSSRQLAVEYKRALDWSGNVPLEEDEVFSSSTTYDALNRPVELTTPDKSRVRPSYNEANLLERIEANLRGADAITSFVEDIDYDAKGQRDYIRYGNGVETEYTYDPLTWRLVRLVTTRSRGAETLQDLSYTFDPGGNITHLRDRAQQEIFFRNSRVEPVWEYAYDAVYRLIEATGREHLGQVGGKPVPTSDSDAPRVGLAHPNDRLAMGTYRERYTYDEVGNIREMAHRGTDPVNPGWTRVYAYEEESQLEKGAVSNRLSSTTVEKDSKAPYTYDEHGSMLSMPHLHLMRWDHADRLQATSKQAMSDEGTPETTYYVHDSTGQRVRKVTERFAAAGQVPARMKERVYLGGVEIYREYDGKGAEVTLERETLHVMDHERRIALVETRTRGGDATLRQITRYQLDNHLGSACLELDGSPEAQIISYEEYHPHGSTAYQAESGRAEAPKRYRYTGTERDEESGLCYHGARYYAPWLGRWTAVDPARMVDGPNLYAYVRGNPIGFRDGSGHQAVSTKKQDITLQTEHGALVISDWRVTQLQLHGKGDVPAQAAGNPTQFWVKDWNTTKFTPKGESYAWKFQGDFSKFEFVDIMSEWQIDKDPKITEANKSKGEEKAEASRAAAGEQYQFGVTQTVHDLTAVARYSDGQTARYPIPAGALLDRGNVNGKLLLSPWKENPIPLSSEKNLRTTQDAPRFSFLPAVPAASGKGTAKLTQATIKGEFAIWWIIQNKNTKATNYLSHVYLNVDLAYAWDAKADAWKVTGGTTITGQGAGKGSKTPALAPPAVQSYLKTIPAPLQPRKSP
jgi:RHS repeat-associated protein